MLSPGKKLSISAIPWVPSSPSAPPLTASLSTSKEYLKIAEFDEIHDNASSDTSLSPCSSSRDTSTSTTVEPNSAEYSSNKEQYDSVAVLNSTVTNATTSAYTTDMPTAPIVDDVVAICLLDLVNIIESTYSIHKEAILGVPETITLMRTDTEASWDSITSTSTPIADEALNSVPDIVMSTNESVKEVESLIVLTSPHIKAMHLSKSPSFIDLIQPTSLESLSDHSLDTDDTIVKSVTDSVSNVITEEVCILESSRRLSIASMVSTTSMVSMVSMDTCSSAGHSSDDNNYKKELFKFFKQNRIEDTRFTCTIKVTHPEYASMFSSNAYSTMKQCESEVYHMAYQHVIAIKCTLPLSNTTNVTTTTTVVSQRTQSNGKRDLVAFIRKKTKVQDAIEFLQFETNLHKPFQCRLTVDHPDFPGTFMSVICGKKKEAESDVCFKALKFFLDKSMCIP